MVTLNLNPAEIRTWIRIVTARTGAPLQDEDLEQEAALRVLQAFRGRADVRHPRAFCMKVVRDTVNDHWRRRRPLEDLESVDEGRLSQCFTAEDDLDRRRQRDALRRAIAALAPRKRATILLFYSENRSVGEIAKLQNKSLSAVKMDLLRTRRELSQMVVSLLNKKSR
jgi:RNA polymerase sigma-70 factor, ECF subfamily